MRMSIYERQNPWLVIKEEMPKGKSINFNLEDLFKIYGTWWTFQGVFLSWGTKIGTQMFILRAIVF